MHMCECVESTSASWQTVGLFDTVRFISHNDNRLWTFCVGANIPKSFFKIKSTLNNSLRIWNPIIVWLICIVFSINNMPCKNVNINIPLTDAYMLHLSSMSYKRGSWHPDHPFCSLHASTAIVACAKCCSDHLPWVKNHLWIVSLVGIQCIVCMMSMKVMHHCDLLDCFTVLAWWQ